MTLLPPRRTGVARATATLSLVAGLGTLGLATSPAALAVANPTCVGFDSATQSTTTGLMFCDVPAGVTALSVITTGAGGGGGSGIATSTGGHGAVVTTTITVTPGETLNLEVGSGGGGGTGTNAQGGGGGGWSAVKRSSTPLVIAGGGGGGGSVATGSSVPNSTVLAGGNAGTPVAAAGTPASMGSGGDTVGSGGGATASAGGTAGPSTGQGGGPGAAGTGGNGGEPCSTGGSQGGNGWQGGNAAGSCYGTYASTGGGGGAGLFGGGGGGGTYGGTMAGGSGGGGSSLDSTGQGTFTLATNGGAFRAAGGRGRIVMAAPAPTVTSVAPASGPTGGGTTITVTGTHFGGGTTVTVGGQPCTAVVVSSATSLTCTTPAGSVGTADVRVTSAGQSATLTGGYSYAVGLPGTPRSVTTAPGRSSLTVSWAPPASGAPVIRYEVYTRQGSAVCSTTTTSCVLGAEAGTVYDVFVVAVGSAGRGTPAQATTTKIASPSVPTAAPASAELTLTTDKGRITKAKAGQDITVIGTGFLPYSTATIVIYSSPTVLGTVVTDAQGNFTKPVTVPTGLAAGTHSLVASGVAPDGSDRFLRMDVSVAGGSGRSAGSLAYTGADLLLPLVLGTGGVVAGALLFLVTRRRREV
ncbi:hypothetical protein DQ237_17955 [Blastococcus sp. TF02-8]|uniref:fibronectin type III domain-containing protein n=1 Tax=Blastococcus sp. TF02-8 TaxID=2250574 RepID=UPI000DE9FDA1|nr:fibronectin type III domain-containing protein [Blastococcus sp. TF02-8]RBY93490.1 hypothetical protein DQ237_17955 [Blastococcus sp. TF02-8]